MRSNLLFALFRFLFTAAQGTALDGDPGTSGGGGKSAAERAMEQALQQAEEIRGKYNDLLKRVEEGKLVDPVAYVKKQEEAGLLYSKERYVGLQQTLQQAQEEAKKASEELVTFKTSNGDLTNRLSALETDKKTAEENAGRLSQKTKRTEILVSKFPQLLPFEFPGEGKRSLLPDGSPEELEAIFGEFASKLTTGNKEALEDFSKSGGSRTPVVEDDSKKPVTATDHLNLAKEAMLASDQKLYDQHYDNYIKALNEETAKA